MASGKVVVTELKIEPHVISLTSPKSRVQLVVTAHTDDGAVFDVTHSTTITLDDPSVASFDETAATIHPRGDGLARLQIRYKDAMTTTTVAVSGQTRSARIRFHSEVLAVLTKQGCNSGACHGSPHGKNGFHLSLLAFAPGQDAESLIFDGLSRRINRQNPAESLLLRKPTLKVPHGGHKRLREGTLPYELLHQWIAEGAADDAPDEPDCVRISITPDERRELHRDRLTQQLAVRASFSDGSIRDVTHLATYSTSHANIARVTESGRVTGHDRGDAAISVRYLEHIQPFSVTVIHAEETFVWSSPAEINSVDRWVNNKLRQLQYIPSETCTDATFVRRVYLDVIGLLPTVDETMAFVADGSLENKRTKLIEVLLRRPEHARFWARKSADLMRASPKMMKDGRAEKFTKWIEGTISENMPFNRFAATLLTASGDTLDTPAANYFLALPKMEDCAEATAQIFMGSRVQCAKCHNHPFENWTQNDYYRLSAVFARVEAKAGKVSLLTKGEARQPATGQVMRPWGTAENTEPASDVIDRREAFVSWLTGQDNKYFARVEVNRIWSHLFGQGIVEPVDDFRNSNPPVNVELLDGLTQEFVNSGYNRRHIIKMILQSQTYQRSAIPYPRSVDEHLRFSHAQVRLLGAEQLHDAMGRVTGTLPASEQLIENRSRRATEELNALLTELTVEQPVWEGGSRARIVDVLRMSGNWFRVGPLPAANKTHHAEIEVFPIDFKRTFTIGKSETARWKLHPEWLDGRNVNIGGRDQVHYVCRRIISRSPQSAEVRLRTPSEVSVWLNGALVYERKAVSSKKKTDQDAFVSLSLVKGPNELLMKLGSSKAANVFRTDIADRGELEPIDDGEELLNAARMLFYGKGDHESDTDDIPQHIGAVLETPRNSRTDAEQELLTDYYHSTRPKVAALRDEIDRLNRRLDFATQRAEPETTEFLTAFGKPERKTACACERAEKPTLSQALQLLNGHLVHEQVATGAKQYRTMGDKRLVETVYLAAYCRLPSETERNIAEAFLGQAENRDDAVEDLLWTILNTRDFLFQH